MGFLQYLAMLSFQVSTPGARQELLQSLGDADLDNMYTQILTPLG